MFFVSKNLRFSELDEEKAEFYLHGCKYAVKNRVFENGEEKNIFKLPMMTFSGTTI